MPNVSDRKPLSTLPPEGAFVLQLQSGVDVGAGSIAGRVEHITTGRAMRFASLDDLLTFIAAAFKAPPARPPP
jgi:hypothetical protein